MDVSVFDLFKIGLGPSSSHTVGPMKAALLFCERLVDFGVAARVATVRVSLHGSLAHTGRGHGTDTAIVLGLRGERPDTVDTDAAPGLVDAVTRTGRLPLVGVGEIHFDTRSDLVFDRRERLPLHSNGMRFRALDDAGEVLFERVYYSVGGGFVAGADGTPVGGGASALGSGPLPHPFANGRELLDVCERTGLSISTVVLKNECALRPEAEVRGGVTRLWATMQACIERGCRVEGILPGGLRVPRRAAQMYRRLRNDPRGAHDPLAALDWVNLWALAVNEENAAGGRVVTAPTNGAAGLVPAVLAYYHRYTPNADDDGTLRFLLAATAIGGLYKRNASISGAEVGCQGEVGVACSMAAGALAEVLGGTPEQVENAAEIGMEHNLGLTCDPIGGLVQVPCIERNAMGAVKAINAARLALSGDGSHKVSLDKVIATMRATGADMSTKYKETARGGLALNVIEC